MGQSYGSIDAVTEALTRKGYPVDRAVVIRAMKQLDLHPDIDQEDLAQIEGVVAEEFPREDRWLRRVRKTLESPEWSAAVLRARRSLAISDPLTESRVRDLHDQLLAEMAGAPGIVEVTVSDGQWRVSTRVYWHAIVGEAQPLCHLLGLDLRPVQRLRETFGGGGVSAMPGLRKILDPQGVVMIGGRSVDHHPTPTHRVIGHMLWNLTLTPDDVVERPSVGLGWERLSDGTGALREISFRLDRATPLELRELRKLLRLIKKSFKRKALASFRQGSNGNERLEKWNRTFPDWAYRSPDALRVAIRTAKKEAMDMASNPLPRTVGQRRTIVN